MLRRLRITEYDFLHKTSAFTHTMYFSRFGELGFGESGFGESGLNPSNSWKELFSRIV